jgi:uncharacterized membrane protein (DUF106 family)
MLNVILGSAVDFVLSPFRDLPPIVGLAAVSVLTAVCLLLVVKATSNQAAIGAARRAMMAALFEIRLFNDDLPAVFRAQGDMLRQNATYLRLALAPILWTFVPITLVVAHLDTHYGYAGLAPGETVLVKATVSTAQQPMDAVLEAPESIQVSTPAVWLPAVRELVWKVKPERRGQFVLTARVNGGTFIKTLDVTNRVVRRSPARISGGLLDQLMYPAERPLPKEAVVRSISFKYPSRGISVFGWDWPWIVVYLVLSIGSAMVLKGPLGVAI